MASSIDLIYTLHEKEAFEGLKKSGIYKNTGKRAIIENIILAVFALFFLYTHFTSETKGWFNLTMAIICITFILILLIVPNLDMKKQAKLSSQNKELKMHLTYSKITMNDGKDTWHIPLDGTSKYKIIDDRLILIITPTKQLVVLPVRAIPRELTVEIQSRIFEGMKEA